MADLNGHGILIPAVGRVGDFRQRDAFQHLALQSHNKMGAGVDAVRPAGQALKIIPVGLRGGAGIPHIMNHHAVNLLRFAGVNRLDIAVGDGGVLYAHIQRVARHTVLVVFGAAGHLVEGVHAHFTPADQVLGLSGIIILIHDLSSLSLFITCPPYH